MSEERPEYCKVCGAPETWCTCLVDQKEELTMKFTEKEIEHLREIAAKATKRPWFANVFAERVVEINTNDVKKIFPKTKKAVSIVHWVGFDSSSIPFSKQVANATFIASAVNTHEAALTVIEQQRAEIERLRSFVEQLVAKCENPVIRTSHTLIAMCRFLDAVHDAGKAALQGGEK